MSLGNPSVPFHGYSFLDYPIKRKCQSLIQSRRVNAEREQDGVDPRRRPGSTFGIQFQLFRTGPNFLCDWRRIWEIWEWGNLPSKGLLISSPVQGVVILRYQLRSWANEAPAKEWRIKLIQDWDLETESLGFCSKLIIIIMEPTLLHTHPKIKLHSQLMRSFANSFNFAEGPTVVDLLHV